MALRVLGVMAHPDDVEFTCAGTLARLKQEAGCEIAIATSTSGDCGSVQHRPDEIAGIRHREAKAAADVLGAEYYCTHCADLFILYDDPTLQSYAGQPLHASYEFDSEGVPSRRVTLVERGVLKGFLMSRWPVKGFPSSNGAVRVMVEVFGERGLI